MILGFVFNFLFFKMILLIILNDFKFFVVSFIKWVVLLVCVLFLNKIEVNFLGDNIEYIVFLNIIMWLFIFIVRVLLELFLFNIMIIIGVFNIISFFKFNVIVFVWLCFFVLSFG